MGNDNNLRQYEDEVVEFTTYIGYRAHARVLIAPDTEGPSDMLGKVIAPVRPEDQPERETRYDDQAQSYSPHADQFAGTTVAASEGLVYLSAPDGDSVKVVDESEIWDEGRFVLEIDDPERYREIEEISG